MRNKFGIFIFLWFVAFFYGCCDSPEIIEPEVIRKPYLKVEVLYFDINNYQFHDGGAIAYYYHEHPSMDFANHQYLGDGIFEKRGYTIKPDLRTTVGDMGFAEFFPKDSAYAFSIIIESNYYKGRFITISSLHNIDYHAKAIFYP